MFVVIGFVKNWLHAYAFPEISLPSSIQLKSPVGPSQTGSVECELKPSSIENESEIRSCKMNTNIRNKKLNKQLSLNFEFTQFPKC